MDADYIWDKVLSFIKNSGLNFKITETAFSANITINKTLLKDKNGEVKSRFRTQTPSYYSNISFKNTTTNPKQVPKMQPKNTSLDITTKPLIHSCLPMKTPAHPCFTLKGIDRGHWSVGLSMTKRNTRSDLLRCNGNDL